MFFIVEDLSEDALAVLEEKHKIDKEGTFGDLTVHINDTNVLPLRGILPCSHQADIMMRSHGLLRLYGNKFAASCQQACCKLIVKTFYPQA